MKNIYILGINSVYHEPAVCLVKNGKIIVAVEEERFNRIRHGKFVLTNNPHELPYQSIDYCLNWAKIKLEHVDYIGFSFIPKERFKKNRKYLKHFPVKTISGELGSIEGEKKFYKNLRKIPYLLEKRYGTDIKEKFIWIPHHLCHSASAFFASSYRQSAILSVDGIGEFTTIMLCNGKNNKIKIIKEIEYPNSLGFLWTKASLYLNLLVGGRAEYGAGKVMALAAYGFTNKTYNKFKQFVRWNNDGNFFVDDLISQFRSGSLSGLEKIFGKSRRIGEPFKQRHMDFAAALQKITNEVLLTLSNYLYKKTKIKNLCLAGGVALNCVTNSYILEKSTFNKIFVEPAANDMGTAIGAAYYIWYQILNKPRVYSLEDVYLGTKYSNSEIKLILDKTKGIKYEKVNNIEKMAAYLIAKGLIVGWFQGRMEFGPRALGNRSILADCRNPDMYRKISIDIKGREFFRPLSPSILEEYVDEWFYRPKGGSDSDQFMIFSYKLKDDKIGLVPAITHVDNSGRLQVVGRKTNKRFYNLINYFYQLTGIPIVINTSFNIGEPIVENPEQAINTFLNSKIDILAIGDYIVFKKTVADQRCLLWQSKGQAITIKDFVKNWINKTGLTNYEKSILFSVDLSNKIPFCLKNVRARSKWFKNKKGKVIKAVLSGQRSAFWKEKQIKFKGCNPQLNGQPFSTKECFFGKERVLEDFRPFGVLTRKQTMREILGWAFFSQYNLPLHQKPLAVYDYGENIGYCLILKSKTDDRIEDFFDFRGISLDDLVKRTEKIKNLPQEVGLKKINLRQYIEEKSSQLIKMNFRGGFRDLLNSNIGNDYWVDNQFYLGDFDCFKIKKIPKRPNKTFLKQFYLQCFIEVIKSSLPLIGGVANNGKVLSGVDLEMSSLYKAYRKKFFAQAKARGWNVSILNQIEQWATKTPVFQAEAKKLIPPSIHGMFNTLPSEELIYKVH